MTIITMMTTWCVRACGLNSLVVYFNVKTHDIWEGNVTIRRALNWEHPFPRVLGYKRRSDLKEVDIKEFRATCTWDILRTWQGTILGHFGMGSQKSCNKWWCVHLLNVMHSTHQWFLFQVLKRGALATTIGSDATTYGWLYQYHSDSYTFIQK